MKKIIKRKSFCLIVTDLKMKLKPKPKCQINRLTITYIVFVMNWKKMKIQWILEQFKIGCIVRGVQETSMY